MSEYSEISEFFTADKIDEACSKPGKPCVASLTDSSVTLTWEKPEEHAELVERYCVSYCLQQQTTNWKEEITNSNQPSVTLHLLPGESYYLKVSAYCPSGISEASDISFVTIPSGVIPPGKPVVLAKTHNSVTLKWEMSTENMHCVQYYKVQYKLLHQHDDWTVMEVHNNTAKITPLIASTTYIFNVIAYYNSGQFAISEDSDMVTTDSLLLVAPCKPFAAKVSDNAITIKWSMPNNYTGQVVHYSVKYCSKENRNKWTTIEKLGSGSAVIDDLRPSKFYIFKVAAHYNNGISEYSEESDPIEMEIEVPNAPSKPTASCVTHNTITLTWSMPDKYASSVEYYTVHYQKSGRQKWKMETTDDANKSIEIADLMPCTAYTFKVTAHYMNSMTSDESDLSDAISTFKLCGKPGKPAVSQVTHNEATLTWNSPDNAHLVKYYKVMYHATSDVQSVHEVQTHNANTTATITSLLPNTEYIFKAFGVCEYGISEESQPSDPIITAKAVCSVPGRPSAYGITETAINLQWTEPINNSYNFMVNKYLIYYCNISTTKWRIFETDGPSVTATVDQLMPSTSYIFKVVAQYGFGSSLKLSAESEESVPIETLSEACSEPGKPEATNITSSSITVTWCRPLHNAHLVKVYHIHCAYSFCSQQKTSVIKVNSAENNVEIVQIPPNTGCLIKVVAEYISGHSKESEVSNVITTLPEICSKPGKPRLVNWSHNAVQLQWTVPDINPHLVRQYCIYCIYQGVVSDNKTVVSANVTEAVIPSLLPSSKYVFKVVAECKCGSLVESLESDVLITLSEPYNTPGKPKATAVTYNTVALEWDESQNKSLVKCYHISYRPHNNPQALVNSKSTPDSRNKILIDCLFPNTPYIFGVRAEGYDSSISEFSATSEVIVTTKPTSSAPGKPIAEPSLVKYDCISLKWAPPQENTDLVKSYCVGYYVYNDPTRTILRWCETPDNSTTLTISELRPNSGYIFIIFARCEGGWSDKSYDSDVIETKPEICSPPGKPYLSEASYNSIILKWDPPEEGAEFVKYYAIHYHQIKNKREAPVVSKTTDTDTQQIIHKLKPNTEYLFKIIAHCINGRLSKSEESDPITTSQEVCSPPGQPVPSQVTKDSVTLTWAKPAECAHLITGYRVLYQASNNRSKWSTVKTSGVYETVDIKNLTPSTTYYFKVIADCGSGPQSKESNLSERIDTRALKIMEKMLSKLKLIESKEGTLQFYELSTIMVCKMKDEEKKLAKYTIGKLQSRNPYPEKVLMILGATGAGKSTLINGVVNYIFGVEWEDNVRLKLVFDNATRSQAHSQTDWITAYTFYHQQGFPFPYTLTIIDTPGFGDTEGLKRDKELISQIRELFEMKAENGGVDHINGIGFVTQASLARLTPTQKYILILYLLYLVKILVIKY